MKAAVIGCGVIGSRRAENLPSKLSLSACVDTNATRAFALAKDHGAKAFLNLNELLSDHKPDLAIVSCVNSELLPTTQKLVSTGVPVLVEKPAARSFEELSSLENPQSVPIKVGFNHRFHPAAQKLFSLLKEHADDPILFIRARYGNGARVGFDQEWRAKKEVSGGGELLDQGVHVIDLALKICPELEVKSGHARTLFWRMPVDDNAWAMMEAPNGACFSMHVSSTEWKNEFQFEVYTRKRKYKWTGLGRSYGKETLDLYTMKEEMGPPDHERFDWDGPDESWKLELESFLENIEENTTTDGGLKDALNCLKRVEDIYRLSSQAGAPKEHPQWGV